MATRASDTAKANVAALPPGNREEQLLAIACKLFANRGYQATSLRDIAEAANITKAALYYYFPNKEALYERVVLESLQSLNEQVSAAVANAKGPTQRIRAFMEASALVMQDNGRDKWVAGSNAFWQGATSGQRLAALELRDGFERLLRQCIADAVAAGELRPVDPAMTGRFLLSALNYMPRWHKADGKYTAVQVMQQFLDMLMYGLVLEPSAAAALQTANEATAPARRRKPATA